MGNSVKKKSKRLHYDLGPVGGSVTFLIGEFNPKEAEQARVLLKLPALDWSSVYNADGVCWGWETKVGAALIWLSNRGALAYKVDLLSHEVSHAVEHIMEYFGYEDQELRARLIGFLCGSVMADTKNLSLR